MSCKNILHLFLFISLVIAEKYFSVNHHIMLSSPNRENSYFGFSVQLQTSNYNGRVIVGAPRSSEIDKKFVESGKIFSCSLDSSECEHFRIDSGYDRGNDSWSGLGFSVDADYATSNRLLACAPKWINYIPHPPFTYKLNGKCYYWRNGEESAVELKPLTSSDLQSISKTYHYLFGEAGFSSSLIEGSKYFVLSTVGLYNWTGGVIQYDATKMHSGNYFVAYPKKYLQTYSYFGYSFAYGKFNSSDVNKIFYVSGAPRSNNLTGKVLLFEELTQNDNLIVRYQYPGQQFGEYFGASIAVADVNGDNIDDLVIGAPMHNEDNKYERGRIYLYITQKNEKGNLKVRKIDQKIIGEESGNRFGTAISNLGDINNDGCEDIAVGAPYYKNRGAIYIYLGQKSSILSLSQIIYAKDVDLNLRGFGYSLSRGVDIDQNFNNDLAVGSYLNGHTVILKTRPTINLKTTLTSNVSQIDMKTSSLQIEYCLVYTNSKVPDVRVTVELSTSNKVVFENKATYYSQKEILKEKENKCKKLILNINDYLRHTIKVTMNIDVFNDNANFCKFCPIVEKKEELKKELSIHFSYGCKGEICKPDLKLSTELPEKQIIIGAQNEININFRIDNLGENAFGVKLFVQIYPSYLKGHIDGMSICTRNETTLIIECNFNEHLETNKKTHKIFNLNIEDLKLSDTQVKVNFTVSSNGQDSDLSNNNAEVDIPVTAVVDYNIITKSEPEQLKITKDLTYVNFIHTYTIENKGQTEIEYLDAYFFIPYEYNNKIIVTNILGCDFQEEKIPAKMNATDEAQENINLNCLSTQIKTLKCKKLKCRLKSDNEDEKKMKSSEIKLSFDVNVAELLEESRTFYLFTSIETDSEYLKMIKHTKSDLISTNVKAANIILYVCLGILIAVVILGIIGLTTYKCGGFKKFKPPVENEEEKALFANKTNPNKLNQENEDENYGIVSTSTANSLYVTSHESYEHSSSFTWKENK